MITGDWTPLSRGPPLVWCPSRTITLELMCRHPVPVPGRLLAMTWWNPKYGRNKCVPRPLLPSRSPRSRECGTVCIERSSFVLLFHHHPRSKGTIHTYAFATSVGCLLVLATLFPRASYSQFRVIYTFLVAYMLKRAITYRSLAISHCTR